MTTISTTSPTPTCADACPCAAAGSRGVAARSGYLCAGVTCAAIAAGGAFVPLVPTTFPLIVASFCLVRSSPKLERKLLRNRFLSPYMKYVDAKTPMPVRAKVIAIASMWTGVSIGAVVLWRTDLPSWLILLQAVLAIIGTVVILRWGRPATVRA